MSESCRIINICPLYDLSHVSLLFCYYLCSMFKPVTASILLLAFIAQTFSAPFIKLDYFINTAAYAKNCVNKAKPKMHCNGQCQMMKKIQQQERQDQENSQQKAESKSQVIYSGSSFATLEFNFYKIDIFYNVPVYPIITGMPHSVFHPPTA